MPSTSQPVLKMESPNHQHFPNATSSIEPKEREKAVRPLPPDGHAASMEGASGVPDKIEEDVEPD